MVKNSSNNQTPNETNLIHHNTTKKFIYQNQFVTQETTHIATHPTNFTWCIY